MQKRGRIGHDPLATRLTSTSTSSSIATDSSPASAAAALSESRIVVMARQAVDGGPGLGWNVGGASGSVNAGMDGRCHPRGRSA